MYLPWPVRPLVDRSRCRRMLRSGLQALNDRSDALKPVKTALSRTLRPWPPSDERLAFSTITQRLEELRNRTDAIRVVGDSVPPHIAGRTILVGEHAANSSTARPWGDVLFQLVRVMQPTNVLELGTCVGMSGSFIAAALRLNNRGHLWTLEGMPDSAAIANETFSSLGLADRVTTIVGRFADTLDMALTNGPYGLAFIDGHHEGDATIEYFYKIKPHLSGNAIVVFDDINWSRSIQDAWSVITRDKDIRDHAVVMGEWGVVAIYS
jgi:predicted O-methyltransferase YrrM